jgi:hypothetical protein
MLSKTTHSTKDMARYLKALDAKKAEVIISGPATPTSPYQAVSSSTGRTR